jgi:lipopolysaccharide export system permease protein
VFISSIERNLRIVTSARSGRMEDLDGVRYLMLSNGQRIEEPLQPTGIKVSEFETYGARVGGRSGDALDVTPVRARTTLALLREPNPVNRAELAWRIGLLFAGTNFVLLALALSSVNPRVGRSGNLVFALFAFILYFNLLNLGQSWVGTGHFGVGGFLLSLHGGVLVLGLLWLAKRHFNWGFPNRRVPAQPATTSNA